MSRLNKHSEINERSTVYRGGAINQEVGIPMDQPGDPGEVSRPNNDSLIAVTLACMTASILVYIADLHD